MITSVTSATEAATAFGGLANALGMGGAILLILLLVVGMLSNSAGEPHHDLDRVLRVVTWPLLLVFATSITIETASIVAGALSGALS
jgi:hypothetical protein